VGGRPGVCAVSAGGGCGIRTREGVNPTRFPGMTTGDQGRSSLGLCGSGPCRASQRQSLIATERHRNCHRQSRLRVPATPRPRHSVDRPSGGSNAPRPGRSVRRRERGSNVPSAGRTGSSTTSSPAPPIPIPRSGAGRPYREPPAAAADGDDQVLALGRDLLDQLRRRDYGVDGLATSSAISRPRCGGLSSCSGPRRRNLDFVEVHCGVA
jgi:hypothetical protein